MTRKEYTLYAIFENKLICRKKFNICAEALGQLRSLLKSFIRSDPLNQIIQHSTIKGEDSLTYILRNPKVLWSIVLRGKKVSDETHEM